MFKKILRACLPFPRLYATYIALLALLLGTIYAISTPKYEVSGIISVKQGLYDTDQNKLQDLRAEQTYRAQVALIQSEDVIRGAISDIGLANLYGEKELRGKLPVEDKGYVLAKSNLNVRVEPLTDLIRISFVHKDKQVAVDFTKKVIARYMQKYQALYRNEGAVSFFWEQEKLSAQKFERTSTEQAEFAAANSIYNIREQQQLLLTQKSKIAGELQTTLGNIADKTAQKAAIPKQLAQMRPVGRLPQVIGLTQGASRPDAPKADDQAGRPEEEYSKIDRLATDPPLLLVRVYQDTIASLVKLQTDLEGLYALEKSQRANLEELDGKLSALATKASEASKLELAVSQSKQHVELFTKKALEEQLLQDMNAKKLSNIQVLQEPTLPLEAFWPSLLLLGLIGIFLSGLPVVAALVVALIQYQAGSPNGFAGRAIETAAVATPVAPALPVAPGPVAVPPVPEQPAAASAVVAVPLTARFAAGRQSAATLGARLARLAADSAQSGTAALAAVTAPRRDKKPEAAVTASRRDKEHEVEGQEIADELWAAEMTAVASNDELLAFETTADASGDEHLAPAADVATESLADVTPDGPDGARPEAVAVAAPERLQTEEPEGAADLAVPAEPITAKDKATKPAEPAASAEPHVVPAAAKSAQDVRPGDRHHDRGTGRQRRLPANLAGFVYRG